MRGVQRVRSGDEIAGEKGLGRRFVGGVGGCMVIIDCQSNFALVHFLTRTAGMDGSIEVISFD